MVEIIFLKLDFYALLCMPRIMLQYHEIIIRDGGRAKREWWRPYQTIIIIIIMRKFPRKRFVYCGRLSISTSETSEFKS